MLAVAVAAGRISRYARSLMLPHRHPPPPATADPSPRRTRGPEFSLATALHSPAFTPRRSDAPALIDLFLRAEVTESAVAQGLLRIGSPAFAILDARLQRGDVKGAARAGLVRLLGRLTRPDNPDELAALLALTRDADPPARRNAIASLGRLPLCAEHAAGPVIESALLALWRDGAGQAVPAHPEDRRALAESLGKLGGPAALAALKAALPDAPEPILRSVLARAVLRLERTTLRSESPPDTAPITATVALPQPFAITFLCRAGLTPLLVQELRERGLGVPLTVQESARIGEPARVTIRSARPLAELRAVRTCTELALPLGAVETHLPPARATEEQFAELLVQHAASALSSPRIVQLLRTLGRGPLRYRIHFTDMGHRRSLVWRIAAAVAERCPELRNDPKDSPWELRIGGDCQAQPAAPGRLELVPRQLPDSRFAYRLGDVPAASHPTLAAALARLCAARPGDVVWDPFVGSGSELIEVALRVAPQEYSEPNRGTPTRRPAPVQLIGSDLCAAALATAAQNAAAAGVQISLTAGDALGPPPPGLTRIITNPPMGRRVRRGEATELLQRFAAHAAKILPRSGQLTWIAPQPQHTSPILRDGGLRCLSEHRIDMNGFWASLQVWVKP